MKKIKTILFFVLLISTIYVSFLSAQQMDQNLAKSFSDKSLGGQCIIDSSKMSVDGQISMKTFEVEVQSDGYYYLSAWVTNTGIIEKNNGLKFFVDDLKNPSGILKPQKEGWQCSKLLSNDYDKIEKIELSAGKHLLIFCSTIPEFPPVEFVRISKEESGVQISETDWINYFETAQRNVLPERYAAYKSDLLNNKKLLRVLPNPEGNYLHEIDAAFSYSYSTTLYLNSGTNIVLETKRNDPCTSDPVMYLFNSSDPVNLGSWGDDDGGDCYQSKITCTIQNSGSYYVFIRSFQSNGAQTTNLYLNDDLYASNIVISGANFICDHSLTEEINYFGFTSNVAQGDPKLWIASYDGKIFGYNDDYSGSGDFIWQQNPRVKKSYSQRMYHCLLTSSSTYYPSGTCDLFMKCKNSTIMSVFPYLDADDAIMSANTNNLSYNCISWSGGRTTLGRWFWPPNAGNPWYSASALSAFDNFWGNKDQYGSALCRGEDTESGRLNQAMNYTRSGANGNNACSALWANNYDYTHGSVKKPANDQPHGYSWESKPGGLMRTFHPQDALRDDMNDPYSYGQISNYYRWDGTWTYGTPPMKISPVNSDLLVNSETFTNRDKERLNNYIAEIPDETRENFRLMYNEWKSTWDRPELQKQSNPRMCAKSDEYNNLVTYCKSRGKQVWPLIISAYEQGDELCINLFEDLTFNLFPGLINQIREEENKNAVAKSLTPSQTANWTKYSKTVLSKLDINDIMNVSPDSSKFKLNFIDPTPNETFLGQNYPNPFNMTTAIRFYLPASKLISLKIYNTLGQEIRNLVDNQVKSSGWHSVQWDGNDNSGKAVCSGIYVYRLFAGDGTFSRKLIILK